MNKNILVTGAAGFIGYHLARKLAENSQNKITLLDNLQRGRQDFEFQELLKSPNVEFVHVDMTDAHAMTQLKGEYQEIYHLAAVVGVKHCMQSPERVLRTNLLSTINVIDLAKRNRDCRLVFSSTCENYASGFELGIIPVPSGETVPLVVADVKNPRLSYAGSKIVGEQMVIFNAPNNYKYSIVRYHNVYGPRMGYAHVIPEVLKRMHAKESPFRIFGANQTRAFCYVDDAVEQTILAMEHEKMANQIVHVGNSSQEVKISDLIKKMFAIVEFQSQTTEEAAPQGSVNRRCPDTTKMLELTGFKPKISVDEGLRRTVKWYWSEIQKGNVWE